MSKAEAEGEPVTEELSLSVEETNRLRISLGLKPLQNETSSGGDAAVAAANFAKEKQRLKARQERKLLISRLAAAENKEKAFARLEGKGLGDADDDNDDNTSALAWAAKLKERNETNRRMLVQRKARELEELDEEYSADQLKGLRVAHNMDDISSDILVLADKRVTDEDADEDELVSAAISAKERLEQNLKNKKKKPVYNAYDDAEFDMPGHKRSLLSQYDEDDEKSGFILGDGGRVDSAAAAATEGESQANGKKTVTLAYEKMQEIKDYYTQEEAAATFLKPKKKKKSSSSSKGKSRTRDVEPDYPNPANPDAMQTDAVAIGSGTTHDFARSNANADVTSVNFVDDDDLQSALSRARNMANRALKRPTTQEMLQAAQEIEAQELAAEINTRRAAADSNSDDEEADEEDAALVMSSTSEFVNNLRTAATLAPSRAGAGPAVQGRPRVREAESDDEEEEERTRAAGRMDIDATEEKEGAKSGDEDDDEDGGGWREPGETSSGTGLLHAEIGEEEAVEDGNLEGGGIEEEPLVAAGMAATVALLNKQGFLEKVGDDLLDRERKQKDRAKWLAEQRVQEKKREIIKEREKQRQREINKAKGPQGKKGGGGGGGGGNSERKEEDDWRAEEEARAAERRQLREVEERFKNYNPDIEIKYNDDWGNPLSQKEAFRYLSHKFHGKGSGKMKTEKRITKLDEEMRLHKMMSADTPLNTAAALAEKTKVSKTAHVVLSTGNRGALPKDVIAAEEAAILAKREARLAKEAAAKLSKSLAKKAGGGTLGAGSRGSGTASVVSGTMSSIIDTSSVVPTAAREKVTFGIPKGAGSGSMGAKRKVMDDNEDMFEDAFIKKRSK